MQKEMGPELIIAGPVELKDADPDFANPDGKLLQIYPGMNVSS